MQILVLNGPNLNLLGQRETSVYGSMSLGEIESNLRRAAARHVRLDFFQSNHEGVLIDQIQQAPRKYQGIVFNPGGYAHTSVALRDAIAAINIPVVEIHISNIHGREEFRSRSITAGVCAGLISGMGPLGYQCAVEAIERLVGRGDSRGESRSESRRDEKPDRRSEARSEPAAEEETAEEREAREAKRRRRGRRGGRGRRRAGEGPEDQREGEDESTETTERTPVDIESKYANLKGATVRRGLDVLAEDTEGDEIVPVGKVTFTDVAAEDLPAEELTIVRTSSAPKAEKESDDAPIRRVRVTGSRRAEPAAPQAAQPEAAEAPAKPAAAAPEPEAEPKPATPPPPAETEEGSEQSRPAKPRRKTAKKTTKKAAKKSTKKSAAKSADAGESETGEDAS